MAVQRNKLAITESEVEIGQVRPNTWNPMRQDDFIFGKTKESLEAFDFIYPIVVRENEGYEIIDGEHRWKAAKELGWNKIKIINLGKIDDITAKKLTLILNETRGKVDTLELARLIDEIKQQSDLTLLPYTPEKVEGLAELLKMPIWQEPQKLEDELEMAFLLIRVTFDQKLEILDKLRDYAERYNKTEGQALYELLLKPTKKLQKTSNKNA